MPKFKIGVIRKQTLEEKAEIGLRLRAPWRPHGLWRQPTARTETKLPSAERS
jgi:hypothetical protein